MPLLTAGTAFEMCFEASQLAFFEFTGAPLVERKV
jgi:hypothetical protein